MVPINPSNDGESSFRSYMYYYDAENKTEVCASEINHNYPLPEDGGGSFIGKKGQVFIYAATDFNGDDGIYSRVNFSSSLSQSFQSNSLANTDKFFLETNR